MKFQCEKFVLDNGVATASRAAAVKSPIPALEGLLLQASEGGLRISGYDLKKGIYTDLEADVSESGAIVLPAKMFGDIVRKLPDGVVTVTTDKNMKTHIHCLQADYDIMGTDAEDYPALPDRESITKNIVMPQGIFGAMIRQTNFAVSDNEARPIYTGELLECDGEKLTMVALDGYRLALRREKIAEGMAADPCSVIVPGNVLSDVEKLCVNEQGPVCVCAGQKFVHFITNNVTVITRKLDGEFLNYHKAVPTEFAFSMKAQRTELIRCADRVGLMIDDKAKNPIRCQFGDGKLNITANTALGRAEDNCVIDGDGGETVIGFNNNYLLQALKAAPADRLLLHITNGSSPIVILPEDENDRFQYMILPVRLRAGE